MTAIKFEFLTNYRKTEYGNILTNYRETNHRYTLDELVENFIKSGKRVVLTNAYVDGKILPGFKSVWISVE